MGKARKDLASSGNCGDDDESAEGSGRSFNNLKRKRSRTSAVRESPASRSSVYRGVTRHRWTGRFEAHLWDRNWNDSRTKKGRQVYLGAYEEEEAAARAYDLAALKFWGHDTLLNFPLSTYQGEMEEMEGLSREEYISFIRRKSSGFSRGVSKYRGVARHHKNGKWEARIGRVFGNKYLYLGIYATQEEAAMAYDMAAIEHRGLAAVTNFDISRYLRSLGQSSNPNPNHPPPPPMEIAGEPTCDGANPPPPFDMLKNARERSPATPPPEPQLSCFSDDVHTYLDGCGGGGAAAADGYDVIFGDLDSLEPTFFHCELDC